MSRTLQERVDAVDATLRRFRGQPFEWGAVDCAKLGAFHLRQMGYHENLKLHKAGTYKTALGAKRALQRAGWGSLSEALDGLGFERIPPAAALPGDVLLLPGTDGFDALGVAAGNGAVVSFHEDAPGVEVLRIAEWSAAQAWRL